MLQYKADVKHHFIGKFFIREHAMTGAFVPSEPGSLSFECICNLVTHYFRINFIVRLHALSERNGMAVI